jgi:hypothetical protein
MDAVSSIDRVKDSADVSALLKPLRDAGEASFAINCLHPWFGVRLLAPRLRQSGAPGLTIACPPHLLRQVLRRTAENYTSAKRLAANGVGPAVG